MKDYSEFTDEELVLSYNKLEGEEAEEILKIILLRYHKMISKIAGSVYLEGADRQDLIQEGNLGLYDAVMAYDSEKNDTFSPFARMCIKRAVLSAVKTYSRKKHQPLNTAISTDVGEDGDNILETKVSNPEELYIKEFEIKDMLERLTKELSPLEKEVLPYRLDGYEYTQIAKILEREPKSVENTIQRIIQKGKKVKKNKG